MTRFCCILPAFSVFFLCGCLYTSHNYNTGRVLKGGQSAVTIGYGKQKLYDLDCWDVPGNFRDSWVELARKDGTIKCRKVTNPDTVPDTSYYSASLNESTTTSWSYGYSLGIRDNWGPFPGLEMGLLLEVPTMPISASFYLRLGLPPVKWQGLKHSATVGYIMGAWADNSYYAGYALSHSVGKGLAYASFRTTLMATQTPDIDSENTGNTFKFSHNRTLVHQLTTGFMWFMPVLAIFPDFITPQVNFIYPNIPLTFSMDSYGYDHGGIYTRWNIGFGWSFN